MRRITIEEFRKIALQTLIAFDEFCAKHEIKYSLCGGTLIGAIRHKGFIPWDDDTDVMMTRPEYEKLSQKWQEDPQQGYTLLTNRTENLRYAGESGKFYAEKTACASQGGIGLAMDIFAMDGLPSDPEYAKRHFKRCHFLAHLFCRIYKRRDRLSLLFRLFPSIDHMHILKKLDLALAEHPADESGYLAILFGSTNDFERELLPKYYFDEFILVEFEGHGFPSIKEYHKYLEHYYGNYMELPPEDQRVGLHPDNLLIDD